MARENVHAYCIVSFVKFWAYLCATLMLFQMLAAHGLYLLHIWGMRGNYKLSKKYSECLLASSIMDALYALLS
jgi:hypothetical protein